MQPSSSVALLGVLLIAFAVIAASLAPLIAHLLQFGGLSGG
jgi:hypothetical protein